MNGDRSLGQVFLIIWLLIKFYDRPQEEQKWAGEDEIRNLWSGPAERSQES